MKKLLSFLLALALLLSLSAAAFAADGEADVLFHGKTYHYIFDGAEIVDGQMTVKVWHEGGLPVKDSKLMFPAIPAAEIAGERVMPQKAEFTGDSLKERTDYVFTYKTDALPDAVWLYTDGKEADAVLLWQASAEQPAEAPAPEPTAKPDSPSGTAPVVPKINPVVPKINPVVPKINPVVPKINPVIPSIPPVPNIPTVPGSTKPAAASPEPSPTAQALPWPANGVIRTADGLGSGTELTIKVDQPSDTGMHIKIYKENGTVPVAELFVGGAGSAKVSLPGGTYTIKDGTGKTWYGPEESFGKRGSYEVMTFDGGSSKVTLDSGYAYTITINVQASPDADSVGSRSTTHEAF